MRLAYLPLILLPLLAWARLLHSPPTESPPPDVSLLAALVALVEEGDLSDIEVSVRQLENSFNSRFQYPWVFFSTQPLGENFREIVSNATQAVCFYEVIAASNHTLDGSPNFPCSAHCHRCSVHHGTSFAKQGRMRDYEWFWLVEPGAHFTQRIDFDLFRSIKDRGIDYGWLTGLQLYWLGDANNHLPESNPFHTENDAPRVDGAADAGHMVDHTVPGRDDGRADGHMEPFSGPRTQRLEGSRRSRGIYDARWKQKHADAVQYDAEKCFGPGSQLGSVAFFQRAGHEAVIQHSFKQHCVAMPTNAPNYSPVEGSPVMTPYPSEPLPEGSTRIPHWVNRGIKPHDSNPRQAPVKSVPLHHLSLNMEKHHTHWNQIYEDIMRQARIPGLKSGNTVIDDRNFFPIYNNIKYLLEINIDSFEGGRNGWNG